MPIKKIFFSSIIGLSFLIDLVLGTSQYPKLLIVVCAIIALYEFVSPYVYTPS
jgi:hypothetical protein